MKSFFLSRAVKFWFNSEAVRRCGLLPFVLAVTGDVSRWVRGSLREKQKVGGLFVNSEADALGWLIG